MVYFICIYLLLNLICFILMGLDKRRAKRGEWRIKESTLWTIGNFRWCFRRDISNEHISS